MARNRSVSKGLARFLDQERFTLIVNGAIGRNYAIKPRPDGAEF